MTSGRMKCAAWAVVAVFLPFVSGFGQGLQAKKEISLSLTVAPYIEISGSPIDWSRTNSMDFAYANCAFTANLGGENPGASPAVSRITLTVNGEESPLADWTRGVAAFPVSRAFAEAPHDGQVKLSIYVRPGAPQESSPRMTITLIPL